MSTADLLKQFNTVGFNLLRSLPDAFIKTAATRPTILATGVMIGSAGAQNSACFYAAAAFITGNFLAKMSFVYQNLPPELPSKDYNGQTINPSP